MIFYIPCADIIAKKERADEWQERAKVQLEMIERLDKRAEAAEAKFEHAGRLAVERGKELTQAQQRIERLETALKYYAYNYYIDTSDGYHQVALEALEENKKP